MTDQKITMDGKWAYRHDPFTQVRVLCVDGAHEKYPVVSMDGGGETHIHTTLGFFLDCAGGGHVRDLVPLQEKRKPREWVVYWDKGELPRAIEVGEENVLAHWDNIVLVREIMDEELALSTIETWKEGDDEINIYAATEPMRTKEERGE